MGRTRLILIESCESVVIDESMRANVMDAKKSFDDSQHIISGIAINS